MCIYMKCVYLYVCIMSVLRYVNIILDSKNYKYSTHTHTYCVRFGLSRVGFDNIHILSITHWIR